MSSVPEATSTATAAPPTRPSEWWLHRGARSFGPWSEIELRRCFGAGMVEAADTVTGPAWDGALSARAAAERLELPVLPPLPPSALRPEPAPRAPQAAPVAASTAANAPPAAIVPAPITVPAPRPTPIAYARAGLGWRATSLWLAALGAVQLALIPSHSLGGGNDGLPEFLLHAAGRLALVAGACFAAVWLLGALVLRRWTSARGPLAAMTLVYVALVGQFWFQPAPVAAPVASAPAAEAPVRSVDEEYDPSLEWARQDRARREAAQASANDGKRPAKATARPAPAGAGDTRRDTAATASAASRPVARDTWHRRADKLYAANEFAALLDHAHQWKDAEPREPNAWLYLGLAKSRLGRPAEAIAVYEHALGFAPDDWFLLRNLGLEQLDASDFRTAIDTFEHALDVRPDAVPILIGLGRANTELGEVDEAVAALERATELEPANKWAWYHLSRAYLRGGYAGRANEAYARSR